MYERFAEPAQSTDPDAHFHRQWAQESVARAMEKLREDWETSGKGELFEALKGSLTGAEPPRSETAVRLEMTEGAVKVAVHRLRQRYRDLLRAEIAETVSDPSDIDEEMESADFTRQLGPYQIIEEMISEEWILATDPVLRRRVWLLRPAASELSDARRHVARSGRPRWLQTVEAGDASWDAFEATRGVPFVSLVAEGKRVLWPTLRHWLHDLASELWEAIGDQTLPAEVSRGIRAGSIFMLPLYVWIAVVVGRYHDKPWDDPGGILIISALVVLGAIALVQLLGLPFRSTASHSIFRLAVVGAKGEPASRSLLLLRWAIVWLPLFLPMSLVAW